MQVDNKTSIDKLAETLADIFVVNAKINAVQRELDWIEQKKQQLQELGEILKRAAELDRIYTGGTNG